ncbi:sigma-70 family RNA polymerase sigma factor [Streptomyces sp. NBC_00237]|uniref:sigma-70 family RNA polymerase sigma factor n=1 Tax=Streptomyces sp. NBC_00237 TaxID=2975687 RepID=UPI002257D7A7|nr:sigma-70 family RNA polymerase sigma factor [Streptomyces sp. NBC_00237]MCX5206230.1 sigma-70 family RNA polymerase sigma factor [Streptomyces sp. NBC_00237]
MPDGPIAVSTAAASAAASYAQIYEEQQPQLVAYARSLTGNPWLAEDLVAEAHFRVWRRLSAGHSVDNVPAYLTTTVRNLATTVGRSSRESPQDPQDTHGPWGAEPVDATGADHDPGTRIASVDLLARVLKQLPERWVKVLWLAEAEDRPLEAVAREVGAGRGATAVLLHRAREGMRQAFLRAYPGTPVNPACDAHWERIPAHVRGMDSERQSDKLQRHLGDCADCRDRLAVLMQANTRLPALVGPALLIFVLGGAAKFLVPTAGAAAVASASASTSGVAGGHGGESLRAVRHVLTGGSKVSATVLGAVAVSVAAAAVGLVLGGADAPVPQHGTATVEGGVPAPRLKSPAALPEIPATRPEQEPVAEEMPRAPEPRQERAPVLIPVQQSPDEPDPAAPRPEAPAPTEAEAMAPVRTEDPKPVDPKPEDPKPVEPTPVVPTPVEPTPVEPKPVEPTPVVPTPVEPTPVEPTPVEPTPVVPTPVEPTPVEPTPVVPTPVVPTPVEPEPVEPTPPPEPICRPWVGPVWICRLP